MKKIFKYSGILLTAYVVVLLINISGNIEYYKAGGDWKSSILFSMMVTTMIYLGFVGLYVFVLAKMFNWQKRPFFFLFLSISFGAVYSCICMTVMMQIMTRFFDWKVSVYDYINNCAYAALITVFLVALAIGIEVLRQLVKSETDKDMMRREMQQTQFEVLKNQVNPHFLFNSLNTLSLLIPENAGKAVDFVQKLSKVFRYCLQHTAEDTIPVTEEMKVIESYFFVNRQRFDDKLVTSIQVDDSTGSRKIVTQSLLMVVENAIKHNEISGDRPLHIDIYNDDEYLIVSNSYQPRKTIETSTGIGQMNIINRYKLITQKHVLIQMSGNVYSVKLPLV